ncbi:MAG: FliA/WhiG family RNA polymerase sigma factor [Candidatus Omnitrophota bacterium]
MEHENQEVGKQLWRDYKQSQSKQAREALIMHYLWFVKYIAGRIAIKLPEHVRSEDLFNSGVIGLIDAVERFDDSRNNSFKTYAFTRIQGSIIDELRSLDWAPRSLRKKARAIKKASLILAQRLNRQPGVAEIAKQLKMPVQEVSKIQADMNAVSLLSLDKVLSSNDDSEKGVSRLMIVESENAVNSKVVCEEKEKLELITEQINLLPEKERLVVTLYYYEEMTLKEISETLNLSESRVSQLHSQVMQRIRAGIKKLSVVLV